MVIFVAHVSRARRPCVRAGGKRAPRPPVARRAGALSARIDTCRGAAGATSVTASHVRMVLGRDRVRGRESMGAVLVIKDPQRALYPACMRGNMGLVHNNGHV
jgi:hypothetical protein